MQTAIPTHWEDCWSAVGRRRPRRRRCAELSRIYGGIQSWQNGRPQSEKIKVTAFKALIRKKKTMEDYVNYFIMESHAMLDILIVKMSSDNSVYHVMKVFFYCQINSFWLGRLHKVIMIIVNTITRWRANYFYLASDIMEQNRRRKEWDGIM